MDTNVTVHDPFIAEEILPQPEENITVDPTNTTEPEPQSKNETDTNPDTIPDTEPGAGGGNETEDKTPPTDDKEDPGI